MHADRRLGKTLLGGSDSVIMFGLGIILCLCWLPLCVGMCVMC
jgi:hypothetical protein